MADWISFHATVDVGRGVVEGMESLHWTNNDMLHSKAGCAKHASNPAKRHDLFVIFDLHGECCGLECSQAVLRVLQHLPSGCSLL